MVQSVGVVKGNRGSWGYLIDRESSSQCRCDEVVIAGDGIFI